MTRRGLVASTFAFGALVTAAPAGAAVTIPEGHADYAVRLVGQELRSEVKDSSGADAEVVWREPADVLIQVRPEARRTVPADERYGFLGAPGADTWLIPQAQEARVVWLGWNTEQLPASTVAGDVRWTLAVAEGPGRVAVFQTGATGQPDVLFDSSDGLPDTRSVPVGVHAHGNWAFSAPGLYRLTFRHEVTRATGEVASDTETLAVEVAGAPGDAGGGPPGGPDTPPGGGSGLPGGGIGGEPEAAYPTAAIMTRRATVRHGIARVRIACRGSRTCRGVLRLRARLRLRGRSRLVAFGRRRYSLAAGRRATVRVKVPNTARRVLRRRSRATVRATAGGAERPLVLRRQARRRR